MFKWLQYPACFVALVAATPAFSAEIWVCNFKSLLKQDYGHTGSVRLKVDGGVLEWQVRPDKQLLKPGTSSSWVPFFVYQVLKNNDVGIVAALSDDAYRHPLGIQIWAWVLMLDKSSGSLLVDKANMSEGASEDINGRCNRA